MLSGLENLQLSKIFFTPGQGLGMKFFFKLFSMFPRLPLHNLISTRRSLILSGPENLQLSKVLMDHLMLFQVVIDLDNLLSPSIPRSRIITVELESQSKATSMPFLFFSCFQLVFWNMLPIGQFFRPVKQFSSFFTQLFNVFIPLINEIYLSFTNMAITIQIASRIFFL